MKRWIDGRRSLGSLLQLIWIRINEKWRRYIDLSLHVFKQLGYNRNKEGGNGNQVSADLLFTAIMLWWLQQMVCQQLYESKMQLKIRFVFVLFYIIQLFLSCYAAIFNHIDQNCMTLYNHVISDNLIFSTNSPIYIY